MRPKALLLTLAFSTLSAPAVAEDAIHVTFGSAGERQAFIFPTLPKDAPTDAIKTRADAVDVPIGDHKPNHAVFVWDRTTGNLASKSILSVKSGWDVKPEDYVDVAQVRVHVTNDGKPVAACNVSLDDHRRTESQLLTPSSDGTATFFAVKPGSIKVTIRYKDGGKDAA